MNVVRERLEKHFDNACEEVKKKDAIVLLSQILSLRDDVFSIIDVYNSTNKEKWDDVIERFVDIIKEFEKSSFVKDLRVIYACLVILRENLKFEKDLLKVLGKTEDECWTQEEIKPAILTVLKSYRKEIKAENNEDDKLERYDILKENIKKVLNSTYSKAENKFYDDAQNEMRSGYWKGDDTIKFLSKALYYYNDYRLKERIISIIGGLVTNKSTEEKDV